LFELIILEGQGQLDPALWTCGKAEYHDGRNMVEAAHLMVARKQRVAERGQGQDLPH
jgi:hypothetical protein